MGIMDTIMGFFKKQEGTKSASAAMKEVKAAAASQNYNLASVKAFYALEAMAENYAEMRREEYTTAREFAGRITESDLISEEEIEPIILNFELAKYSENQISLEDYSKVEESLEVVNKKFRTGKVKETKTRQPARRRRPTKGGRTGAARSGKAPRRRKRKTGKKDE